MGFAPEGNYALLLFCSCSRLVLKSELARTVRSNALDESSSQLFIFTPKTHGTFLKWKWPFLLGIHGGAKVCNHERFTQEPSLRTALAYEAMYQKPVSELFPGCLKKSRRR